MYVAAAISVKLQPLQTQNSKSELLPLLAFKNASVSSDLKGFLADWSLASTTPNPCLWSGVLCSPHGKVSALNFTGAGLSGRLYLHHLTHLEELRHLHFSGNYFAGDLNLDNTTSNSCIFETLDLSSNNLSDPIAKAFFTSCTHLTCLNLSGNSISVDFSEFEFVSCSRLQVLDLSYNYLQGSSAPLSLTNCQLVEHLDLSHNSLHGTIFPTLGNLNSLSHLHLKDNFFSGEIPPELVRTCGKLQKLDLSGNNITGPIPSFLRNCSSLQILHLASNAFTGDIPSWICSNSNSFPVLRELVLGGNFLSGTLPAELGNCKQLRTLDLSLNYVTGEIPLQVWLAPSIRDLVLWGNNLSGEIPESVCSTGNNLESLILNNNNLSGAIPASLANCKTLAWLSLSSNNLEGEIPASFGTLEKLNILQLSHNSLSGTIPQELRSCRSMVWLDLKANHLTGVIPSQLANQSFFVTNRSTSIIMRHSTFLRQKDDGDGNGIYLCKLPNLLYLEKKSLSRLASFLGAKCLRDVSIFSGINFITLTGDGRLLLYLDLSFNNLDGSIPESIGLLQQLIVLRLSYNRLNGLIPDTMSGLKAVGVLDLSHNQLEGSIPESLELLTFLSDLYLSNNQLSGLIPEGGQLMTFTRLAYENNSGLCGYPLPPCGSQSTGPETDVYPPEEKEVDWFWLVASIGFVAGVVSGLCIGIVVYERNEESLLRLFCMARRTACL